MTDDEKKSPIEHTLDVFVYLPLGFVLELPRSIPQYIDRGRRELSPSRLLSRGGRSSPAGLFDTGERLARLQAQTQGTLRALGITNPVLAGTDRDGSTAPVNGSRPAGAPADTDAAAARTPGTAADDGGRPDQTDAPGAPAATQPAEPAPDPSDLAITDYDSLSASQVVPRLDSLAADELEGIRAYETATRGRKTILNKIAQIQSA